MTDEPIELSQLKQLIIERRKARKAAREWAERAGEPEANWYFKWKYLVAMNLARELRIKVRKANEAYEDYLRGLTDERKNMTMREILDSNEQRHKARRALRDMMRSTYNRHVSSRAKPRGKPCKPKKRPLLTRFLAWVGI